CVCGKKIGPDPRNFNQRVSLGRNDLLIRTFPNIGVHHNRTPIYEKQVIGDIEVDTFRFYFEGLICHIIHSYDGDIIKGLEPVFIEASSELLVITHKFEDSRAFSDLKEVISSSFDECS
ncbi:hypothetical protein ACT3U0_25695, partial [Klebsiella pneumoniae]